MQRESEQESVISDIHAPDFDEQRSTEILEIGGSQYPVHQSKIVFSILQDADYLKVKNQDKDISVDADGDLIVRRQYQNFSIHLDHCAGTPVSLVGLQAWPAALFLSDYLIHSSELLKGKDVLELGSGLGICSMVASLFAKNIFCTDSNEKVLALCKRNIQNFVKDFKDKFDVGSIHVKELNWFSGFPNEHGTLNEQEESQFSWTETERNLLKNVHLFLASDVIYVDDATKAFFKVIKSLMENSAPSQLFLTFEKRINFTLDVLDVSCPSYDIFLSEIESLRKNQGEFKWRIYRSQDDFPQSFHYERTRHLKFWIFECDKLEV